MVFSTTFNNISVKSWRSVLLVKETGVDGENHQLAESRSQIVSHNVVSSTTPTFNNISVKSWRSVLLVKETGVDGENHQLAESRSQIVSHNVVSSTTRHESEFTTLVVKGTECIGICKSLYSIQLRDRPINLQGRGLWFFFSFISFFSDNTRVRIFLCCRAKPEFFFLNLKLGYMTKTLNQIIFFPPPESEYFFQQHWVSEYIFRKKTLTPPGSYMVRP